MDRRTAQIINEYAADYNTWPIVRIPWRERLRRTWRDRRDPIYAAHHLANATQRQRPPDQTDGRVYGLRITTYECEQGKVRLIDD